MLPIGLSECKKANEYTPAKLTIMSKNDLRTFEAEILKRASAQELDFLIKSECGS